MAAPLSQTGIVNFAVTWKFCQADIYNLSIIPRGRSRGRDEEFIGAVTQIGSDLIMGRNIVTSKK